MLLADLEKNIAVQFDELRSPNISNERRQDVLMDIGFLAAAIDNAAYGRADEELIRRQTDDFVCRAEDYIFRREERSTIDQNIPSRARAISMKYKI